MKKFPLILIYFFLCTSFTVAQITVNLRQPPLNQLKIGDLWNLTITNNSSNNYAIYLQGTASERNEGLIVEAKSSSFQLKANERKSFTPNNIGSAEVTWKNNQYKEIIIRTGTAPSGNYTICVFAKLESTGAELGSDCKEQKVEKFAEIALVSPDDGAVVSENNPKFLWLPLTGGTKTITYSLKIAEIPKGQSPEEAISKKISFFEKKDIESSMLIYPVSGKNFDSDKDYAWQVKAYSGGISISESEVWKFTWKSGLVIVTPVPLLRLGDKVINLITFCDSADIALWNKIKVQQLGVAGNDFDGVDIFGTAATYNKEIARGFREFYPVDGSKRTLVGTLSLYKQTDDWAHVHTLGDVDYNIFIVPDPDYSYINRDYNCSPVECEIAVAHERRIFSPGTGYLKYSTCSKVGVYGMWIMDHHVFVPGFSSGGEHVEIHPAEQIWFHFPDDNSYILNFLADVSDRFDDYTDYLAPAELAAGAPPPPDFTKPWAELPMNGVFAVAFEIKPGDTTLFYSLRTMAAESSEVQEDGLDHRLIFDQATKGGNRKILIELREIPGVFQDFVSVDFDKVCMLSDGTIHGYIVLKSKIDKTSSEGGHVCTLLQKLSKSPYELTHFTLSVESVKRIQNNGYCPLNSIVGTDNSVSLEVNTWHSISAKSPVLNIPIDIAQSLSLEIDDYVEDVFGNYVVVHFTATDSDNHPVGDTTLTTPLNFDVNQKVILTNSCIHFHTTSSGYKAELLPPEEGRYEVFEVSFRLYKFKTVSEPWK
jgi:hypothetical protein